jgi:hypothetical protein
MLAVVDNASIITLRRHAPIFAVLWTAIVRTKRTDRPVLAHARNQSDKFFLFG